MKPAPDRFFMMTWAYKDKPEMTSLLADATIEVANENSASVIPYGMAFERSSKDFPEISSFDLITDIRR